MKRAIWILLGLLCLVLLPALVFAGPPAQEQVSGNLLVDGDFEAPPAWPQQDGIGEVQVAPGWRAYYLDAPPKAVPIPSNCSDRPRNVQCFWMRPEFRDNTSFANRIHSGVRSQKYFSYGRMHEAGLMQQVHGLPSGARVRFSIWTLAWMCANPDACGKDGTRSDAPADMHLRVGIDPLGGTDAFTPTVVWSAEKPAWDTWVQFQVETTAISDTVTVFTHSRAEWLWARLNNDVYLDDASLVIVGAFATQARSVSLGTPFPEDAVTHTLGMGETLFDVSLQYQVQVSDLLKLNQITSSTELYVGQPLVVQRVTLTPTRTPLPTEVVASPVPSSTPQPTGTSPVLTSTLTPTRPPPVEKPRPNTGPIIIIALIVLAFAIVLGSAVWVTRRQ